MFNVNPLLRNVIKRSDTLAANTGNKWQSKVSWHNFEIIVTNFEQIQSTAFIVNFEYAIAYWVKNHFRFKQGVWLEKYGTIAKFRF